MVTKLDDLVKRLEKGESKRVMLTLEGCDICEEEKSKRAEDLKNGNLEEVCCSDDKDALEKFENLKFLINKDMAVEIDGEEQFPFPRIVELSKTDQGLQACTVDMEDGTKKECKIIKTPA